MSEAEREAESGTMSGAERSAEDATVSRSGVRQFINCASATAAIRFPTPSGPAKITLGGNVPRVVARAIKSSRCRCPVM